MKRNIWFLLVVMLLVLSLAIMYATTQEIKHSYQSYKKTVDSLLSVLNKPSVLITVNGTLQKVENSSIIIKMGDDKMQFNMPELKGQIVVVDKNNTTVKDLTPELLKDAVGGTVSAQLLIDKDLNCYIKSLFVVINK
ncbi:hypothetical protein [Saccharolobus sp.]|uniref:hypothetical protein n=1 Tax=Saccharolobus sp. TaxID=2100761 RepID=UPI003174F627